MTSRIFLLARAALLAVVFGFTAANAASGADLGPFGPEGPRLREQLWLVPSGDPAHPQRATLFKPAKAAKGTRFPLVVINHGTGTSAEREGAALPVLFSLAKWFVSRGYAVALPQRRGHGATGGRHAEDYGSCSEPDYATAGLAGADDIAAAIDFLGRQDEIDATRTLVVGQSSGGWAALALASRNPANVFAVVNFAGGRGGRVDGVANRNCAPDRLIAAAGEYGKTARIPTIWIYARNDSYFDPPLAKAMAEAWWKGGGSAELWTPPPFESDGHRLAGDPDGAKVWEPILRAFLFRYKTVKR